MENNETLIRNFYTAFQQRDFKAMQNCYADDIVFNDSVFRDLRGGRAKAMWHMLLSGNGKLDVEFNNIRADEKSGSCNWVARYEFSRTKRPVTNRIKANFIFRDGKIAQHTDDFNFYKWIRMAFGFSGFLVGWTNAAREKVRKNAADRLDAFIEAHPEYKS